MPTDAKRDSARDESDPHKAKTPDHAKSNSADTRDFEMKEKSPDDSVLKDLAVKFHSMFSANKKSTTLLKDSVNSRVQRPCHAG